MKPPGALRRRTVLRGVAGGAASLALAACGPLAGGTEGQQRPARQPVTLRVSSAASEMGEMAAARYPAFTAAHPGVTAVFEDTPDYSAKLTVLAAADGLGDLAMVYLSSGAYQLLAPHGCGVRIPGRLRGGTLVLVEQAAQPITAPHVTATGAGGRRAEWWLQPKGAV